MNEDQLPWLLGDALRRVTAGEFDRWELTFASGGVITVECPWRLLREGTIVVSSVDHGKRYGLPAPIDAASDLLRHVDGSRVSEVAVIDGTADLHISFGSSQLQILSFSTGYEAWQSLGPEGDRVIAQGGGQLAVFPRQPPG